MMRLLMTTLLLLTPTLALGQGGGSVVDRNIGDSGPNSVSQRVVEPGLARWSRESSLVDRFGQADPQWADRVADPRLNQRYMYQAPGLTALVTQPDYAVLTPGGDIARNRQGVDGAVIAITPANIVYILSPEYFNQAPAQPNPDPDWVDTRVTPTPVVSTGLLMDGARVDGRYDPNAQTDLVDVAAIHGRVQAQRHPELVERSRQFREQRERERQEARAAEQTQQPSTPEQAPEQSAGDKPAQ